MRPNFCIIRQITSSQFISTVNTAVFRIPKGYFSEPPALKNNDRRRPLTPPEGEMAQSEVTEIVVRLPEPPSQEPPNNPFLSLISKFLPKPQEVKTEPEPKADSVNTEESVNRADGEEDCRSNSKPEVVRFPVQKPDVPPLKVENEEAEKDTNPIVLWQVC